VFPIEDYRQRAAPEFELVPLRDPNTVEECHDRGMTFAIP